MIRSKSALPYKTIQTDIYKPEKPCGKRIPTRKSVTYEVRRFTRMSFLPLLFQRRCLARFLQERCHRKIISHSDGHSVVNGKTKSRYTDIKKRRELCSRFKMMFYVTALKFKTILFLCPSATDSTKQLMTAGSDTSS